MLCFLTRRFPFFTSNDDTEALMEIAAIFGKARMEKCAAMHCRSFLTNVPNIEEPEYGSLHELVRRINPNIFVESIPADDREKLFNSSQRVTMQYSRRMINDMDHSSWYKENTVLYQAIDLLRRCLILDCTKRICAGDALKHPFITVSLLPHSEVTPGRPLADA